MSDSLSQLTREIVAFRDARDWAQFHDPKNLALAISIEAAELNEHFLWKKPADARVEGVLEELADVFIYALMLAHHYDADPAALIRAKLLVNDVKYPVERARGRADKYTDL
ncbi:MAG: nucleotide pyrophosphohydrolase [Longimicrobiales bacterium]